MQTIILIGGGTGGHVYPNLALLPELKKLKLNVLYVGGAGDVPEKRLAENCGLPYLGVTAVKFRRGFSLADISDNAKIPYLLFKGVAQAKSIIEEYSPVLVFSKGGFASLPVALAALKAKVPVICHESDLTLGLANKIAVGRGAKLLVANPHSKKGEFVGMPIRQELLEKADAGSIKRPGAKGVPTLLVVGGSGGAKAINDLVSRHLEELLRRFEVVHIYGKNGGFKPTGRKGYRPIPYADDMGTCYKEADVVLSRAGATAVFEIATLEKRAVFLPLEGGASRGDQLGNAELAREYGGIILRENEHLDDSFLPALENALAGEPMRPISVDANGKIAEIIRASIGRGELCKNKKP